MNDEIRQNGIQKNVRKDKCFFENFQCLSLVNSLPKFRTDHRKSYHAAMSDVSH